MSQNDSPPPAVITLRPLGSSFTVGAAGLAMASLVQSGLELHWVAKGQSPEVGLILVSVPFLLQFLACVLAYLARDGALGAAVGILSANWLAIGLIRITSVPGSHSGALGLLLLCAGALLLLTGISVSVTKPLPGGLFALAALRFCLTGIHELGASSAWGTASGIVGLVITAGACYCVIAFELEDQLHRAWLPTLRRKADPPGTASQALLREPGVRSGT